METTGPKCRKCTSKKKKNPDGYIGLTNGSAAFLVGSRAVYTGDPVLMHWMSILVVKMIRRKVILLQADVPQIQPNSATECACDRLL